MEFYQPFSSVCKEIYWLCLRHSLGIDLLLELRIWGFALSTLALWSGLCYRKQLLYLKLKCFTSFIFFYDGSSSFLGTLTWNKHLTPGDNVIGGFISACHVLQHSLPWLTTRFLWSFSRNWASPSPQNTLIPPSPPLFLCGMLSLAPLLVLVYILGRVLVTSKRKRIWLIYVKYSLLVSYQIPVETEKSTLENWHELRKDSKPISHHMNSLARMVILGTRWNISRFALIVHLMSLSPRFGHQKRREKLLSLLSFWRVLMDPASSMIRTILQIHTGGVNDSYDHYVVIQYCTVPMCLWNKTYSQVSTLSLSTFSFRHFCFYLLVSWRFAVIG